MELAGLVLADAQVEHSGNAANTQHSLSYDRSSEATRMPGDALCRALYRPGHRLGNLLILMVDRRSGYRDRLTEARGQPLERNHQQRHLGGDKEHASLDDQQALSEFAALPTPVRHSIPNLFLYHEEVSLG